MGCAVPIYFVTATKKPYRIKGAGWVRHRPSIHVHRSSILRASTIYKTSKPRISLGRGSVNIWGNNFVWQFLKIWYHWSTLENSLSSIEARRQSAVLPGTALSVTWAGVSGMETSSEASILEGLLKKILRNADLFNGFFFNKKSSRCRKDFIIELYISDRNGYSISQYV